MEKPEYKHIEQYITNPEELTDAEKSRIEYWITADPEVNHVYEWLKEFYREYTFVRNSKLTPRERPSVITLTSATQNLQRPNTVILAAQTSAVKREKSTLRSLRTLISEKDKTLIRVLENQRSNSIDIHVLSEYMNEDEILLLDLPGADSLLISEEGGRFHLEKETFDLQQIAEWDRCKLFLPVARVDLFYDRFAGHVHMDTHNMDKTKQQVNVFESDDKPTIEVIYKGTETVNKAVVKAKHSSHFFPVQKGRFHFDRTLLLKNDLSVFFYN